MPAEIDTGGHRVLHCNSRADCPTATSIHASTFPNDECRADRTRLSARIDGNESSEFSRKRASKDRRRKTGNRVRKAESLGCRRGNLPDESSPTRVPRIGDKEETILGGRDFLAKSRALTQSHRRRRRRGGGGGGGGGGGEDKNEDRDGLFGACRVSRESPRAIEDVAKDERFSVTWKDSREDAGDETERAESRLRDEAERYRLAIVDANSGGSIARRRSLRNRSRTRPRPPFYGSEAPDTDPTDHSGGTRTTGGSPLLSSHYSRTGAKDETYGDEFRDVDEGFFREEFDDDENRRLDCDERPENAWDERISRDSAGRKRIRRACRVYAFLQLTLLLFLVAFGRHGPLGSSSVHRVSVRPIANGLSVLGIGIIGAVNARSIDPIGDAGTRAERSANLSHMTGVSNKIRMYIKNRYLQILPDGTVNGSYDTTSNYIIFQRISKSRGEIKIQNMATCLYLCMDSCGLLYGANYTHECLFKEDMVKNNYNLYSSVHWSTASKTLYIGLNRHGQPRRIQVKGYNLGKLATYARVLTQFHDEPKIRHHGNCHHQVDVSSTMSLQEKDGRDRFRCRKRKKRKKRKRRCKSGEQPGPQCQVPEEYVAKSVTDIVEASSEIISASSTTLESKRSCEEAASEEVCRRQALSVPAKKRKSRIDDGSRNPMLGKNKASTSNAKKPNVSVADSQSKKPDLTDGKKKKKKKKKRTGPQQASQGSVVASPSRKQYGPGTTSSSRASSSPMALASEEQLVSTATLSSSPSPPGASTALFSIRRPSSPPSDRKKSPPSSKSHVTRLVGSRRIGKFFPSAADSPARPRSMPAVSATSRSEIAFSPSTTKVPVDTCAYTTTPLPQFSPISPSSSLPWQESDEDPSSTLSYSSLVDEESFSTVTSELAIVTVESSTLAASDKDITDTVLRLEKNCEDGGCDMSDTVPRTTTRFPLERLAM